MNKKPILLLSALLLSTLYSFAQTRQIKGTVINNDNFPMAGVSVMIKGTIYGTTTDANGQYNITTRADSVSFVFSYLGCTTLTIGVPGGKTTVNVTMDCNNPDATKTQVVLRKEPISSTETKYK